MKKLLIWNFSQVEGLDSNLGDRLIFEAMVRNIKQIYSGDCEIYTLSKDPEYTKRLGVTAFPLSPRGVLRAVKAVDIIILGGGELIQDKTSKAYLIANLFLGAFAILRGIPFCCYGIGVASRRELSDFGGKLSRILLNKALFITVRDPASEERLRELGIVSPKIYTTADEVFSGLPGTAVLSDDGSSQTVIEGIPQKYIVVSPRKKILSSFSWFPSSYSFPNEDMLDSENALLAKKLSSVLDKLHKEEGLGVVFTPFYPAGKFSQGDHQFSEQIARGLSHIVPWKIIDPRSVAYEEIGSIFSNAELVLGMTLHSLIVSTVVGTPQIAISYGSKITNLMGLLNASDRLCLIEDVVEKDPAILENKLFDTYKRRDQLEVQISSISRSLREKSLQNSTILHESLDSKSKGDRR